MSKSTYLLLLSVLCILSCSDDGSSPIDHVEIYELSQYIGQLGDPLIISGSGFGDNPQVFFNDVPAELVSSTPNQISTIVPDNAYSGAISVVVNRTDTVKSLHFDVIYSLMEGMVSQGDLVSVTSISRPGAVGFEFSTQTDGHILGVGICTNRILVTDPNFSVTIWDTDNLAPVLRREMIPVVISPTEFNHEPIQAFQIESGKRYRITVSGPGMTYVFDPIIEKSFRDLTIHFSVRNSNQEDNRYPDEAYDSYLTGLPDIIFLPED